MCLPRIAFAQALRRATDTPSKEIVLLVRVKGML